MNDDALMFQTLLAPVLGTAYRAALYLAGNSTAAETMVEEAALIAYGRYHERPADSSFPIWFLGITSTVMARQMGEAAAAPSAAAAAVERDPAETRRLLARLSGAQVAAAVRQVPAECRVVVALDLAAEVPLRELAAILDSSLQLVRTWRRQGRRALHALLQQISERESSAAAFAAW